MIAIILQLAIIACSAVIICRVEPVIARMTARTCTPVRIGYIVMCIGACWLALNALAGGVPDPAALCVATGLAFVLGADRRKNRRPA